MRVGLSAVLRRSLLFAALSLVACSAGAPAPSSPAVAPAPPAVVIEPAPSTPARVALPVPPAGDEGCPPGMAHVGVPPRAGKGINPLASRSERWAFCIDRWEAHLAIEEGGELWAFPHNHRPEVGARYVARSAPGMFPQAYVSRVEAQAACRAAGKRLCKRSEWLRACRGQAGWTYPYANRLEPGRCNAGKPHLLSQFFGSEVKKWTYEMFNEPRLDAEPGFLERSGEHERCASADGVYDLNGNLHEWVADSVDASLVRSLRAEPFKRKKQPWRPGNGVFMGGFFSTTNQHGPGCHYTTIAHEPKYHDYSTGFRCCADG